MMQKYKAEVQEKWGKTDAYREFEEKTKGPCPLHTFPAAQSKKSVL